MDMPESENYLVFFNNKKIVYYISADDEEGWIEIVDINKMSPLENKTPEQWQNEGVNMENEIEGWETIPTIRKYGKVEFKSLT